MSLVTVSAGSGSVRGSIRLPASKSISNRLLIMQALSSQKLALQNISDAHDTWLMADLLKKINTPASHAKPVILNCENAGTVFRFLTALLAITPGNWVLTGSDRMKQRPVNDLVDALLKTGARITYTEKPGYPPLAIEGKKIPGGETKINTSVSSQFVSALMMIGPALEKGLKIMFAGNMVSKPYLEMTAELMKQCGAVINLQTNHASIAPQPYTGGSITIESDWSAASFWYQMAALGKNTDIRLENLSRNSVQGDSILPELFKQLGVSTRFEPNGVRLSGPGQRVSTFIFDFSNHPDLALPVIVTCAALNIKGRFSGLESLRIKESDRLTALMNELIKLGYDLQLSAQHVLTTLPKSSTSKGIAPPDAVNTYADHRMAMAFAPLALVAGSINIAEPEVVAKSYPGFWEDMAACGFDCKF